MSDPPRTVPWWEVVQKLKAQLAEANARADAAERRLEALQGMTFREWCEWITARIREGKL